MEDTLFDIESIDTDTKCYEKYHKYMINNMNNNIIVDVSKNKSNDIVNLKMNEMKENKSIDNKESIKTQLVL